MSRFYDYDSNKDYVTSVQTEATSLPRTASNLVESDPTGRKLSDPGSKADAGKAPVYQGFIQYFARAIQAVAEVSAFGSKKYNEGKYPTTWKEVPDGLGRYTDALGRHLLLEAKGELYAPDSGLLHAAHAAWNALARLEKIVEEEEARKCRDVVRDGFSASNTQTRDIHHLQEI